MSIIDKLGITPVECELFGFNLTVFDEDEVREIERQRNQMLEALIEITIADDECFSKGSGSIEKAFRKPIDKRIKVIESATGKSWNEIKEMMKDE